MVLGLTLFFEVLHHCGDLVLRNETPLDTLWFCQFGLGKEKVS